MRIFGVCKLVVTKFQWTRLGWLNRYVRNLEEYLGLSNSKIDYIGCPFSISRNKDGSRVTMEHH